MWDDFVDVKFWEWCWYDLKRGWCGLRKHILWICLVLALVLLEVALLAWGGCWLAWTGMAALTVVLLWTVGLLVRYRPGALWRHVQWLTLVFVLAALEGVCLWFDKVRAAITVLMALAVILLGTVCQLVEFRSVAAEFLVRELLGQWKCGLLKDTVAKKTWPAL